MLACYADGHDIQRRLICSKSSLIRNSSLFHDTLGYLSIIAFCPSPGCSPLTAAGVASISGMGLP